MIRKTGNFSVSSAYYPVLVVVLIFVFCETRLNSVNTAVLSSAQISRCAERERERGIERVKGRDILKVIRF